jgi:hypothetical protein
VMVLICWWCLSTNQVLYRGKRGRAGRKKSLGAASATVGQEAKCQPSYKGTIVSSRTTMTR